MNYAVIHRTGPRHQPAVHVPELVVCDVPARCPLAQVEAVLAAAGYRVGDDHVRGGSYHVTSEKEWPLGVRRDIAWGRARQVAFDVLRLRSCPQL